MEKYCETCIYLKLSGDDSANECLCTNVTQDELDDNFNGYRPGCSHHEKKTSQLNDFCTRCKHLKYKEELDLFSCNSPMILTKADKREMEITQKTNRTFCENFEVKKVAKMTSHCEVCKYCITHPDPCGYECFNLKTSDCLKDRYSVDVLEICENVQYLYHEKNMKLYLSHTLKNGLDVDARYVREPNKEYVSLETIVEGDKQNGFSDITEKVLVLEERDIDKKTMYSLVESFVASAEQKTDKEVYSSSPNQEQLIYQKIQMEFLVEDAKAQYKEYLRENDLVLPNSFKHGYWEELAETFLDKKDCNESDNSVWERIISNSIQK